MPALDRSNSTCIATLEYRGWTIKLHRRTRSYAWSILENNKPVGSDFNFGTTRAAETAAMRYLDRYHGTPVVSVMGLKTPAPTQVRPWDAAVWLKTRQMVPLANLVITTPTEDRP